MAVPLIRTKAHWKQIYDAAPPKSSLRAFAFKQMSKVNIADIKLSLKGSRKRRAAGAC